LLHPCGSDHGMNFGTLYSMSLYELVQFTFMIVLNSYMLCRITTPLV
jgi:hypothetical protein